MTRMCGEEPPDDLIRGIGEFNGGGWYECHETLEELWAGEQGEAKNLYRGYSSWQWPCITGGR